MDLFIHPDAPEDWLEYIPKNDQQTLLYQYFLESMIKEMDNIMKKRIPFDMTRLKFETKKTFELTNDELPCYDCFIQSSNVQRFCHSYDETHFRQKYLKEKESFV